ncbi:MAG TPA: phytanoyl-CoA dioxygenase family protein [Pyrinomonadaceae bacterium]
MKITPLQIDQYHRDGFLVLEEFVPITACDDLRARAEELVAEFDPHGLISIFSTSEQNRLCDEYFFGSGNKICFFFEAGAFGPNGTLRHSKDKSINKIGHALHDLDPVFNRFSRTRDLAELVTALGIVSPLLLQSMYIFKQPKIGGEVSCHQDSTFLYTEPIDIAGFWFALEDASIENGCLWAIPGGHKLGLKSRWVRRHDDRMEMIRCGSPTLKEGSSIVREPSLTVGLPHRPENHDWPQESLIPLEVKKGTLIVLHGLLPHKSLANYSATSRHAYTLHVIGGRAEYPADNWLQRSLNMPLKGF